MELGEAETRLLAARGATDPNATWEQQQQTAGAGHGG